MNDLTLDGDDVRSPEDAVIKYATLAQLHGFFARQNETIRTSHLGDGMKEHDRPVLLLTARIDASRRRADACRALSQRFQDHVDQLNATVRRNAAMAHTQQGGYAGARG